MSMNQVTKSQVLDDDLKDRRCLMCREVFASEGPHNRVCRRCRGSRAWRDGVSASGSFEDPR